MMLIDDFESQRSTSSTPQDESKSLSHATHHSNLPKLYEEMIQKYEKDIRNHISIENQMRVYIDTLTH